MYDVIIIGGGVAGLTSALYALRANLSVLVLESTNYGGQIINSPRVDNYPGIKSISGFEFATNLYNQVMDLGLDFKLERVISINDKLEVSTEKNTYKAKSIIIATGLTKKTLPLDNVSNLTGKGISYCATCDGHFYKDKTVAVVGGGNSAFYDVLYLSNLAKKVYLIHHKDTFKAYPKYVLEAEGKDNIEFLLNSEVTSINGSNLLESIDVNDKTLKVDGLFIAIGQKPQNEIFSNIIEMDDLGFIKSDDGVHTNIKHVYVAGDTRVKELRQLITAAYDGAMCVETLLQELKD